MTDALRLMIEGTVARISIDRATKRNAFDQAMWETFPQLVEQAVADPGVRVLLLASAVPGIFCAGADIGEFVLRSADPDWRRLNQAAIGRTQRVLANAAKPTIAVIDGDCIGGGCGLALACDLRVATRRSRFGITPAKLGLVYPLHDTKLLVDLVGPSQAKRILFTADLLDAAEASRIGLVTMLSDDALATAEALAASMAGVSAHTQRQGKLIVRRILDGQVDDDAHTAELFDSAFLGPDFAEGAGAFLEKRPARFG